MSFRPTQMQIIAAQNFAIAETLLHETQKTLRTLKQEILLTCAYHYDNLYYDNDVRPQGKKLPSHKILTNPEHIYMMSGTPLQKTVDYYCTDACHFVEAFDLAARRHGYTNGCNTERKMNQELTSREGEFIRTTCNIHGIQKAQLNNTDEYAIFLASLKNLFQPYIKNEGFETKEKQYHDEYIQAFVQVLPMYKDDAPSFEHFCNRKKRVVMSDWLLGNSQENDTDIIVEFKNVYSFLYYTPDYTLFEIETNASWEYQPGKFTTCNYAIRSDDYDFFETNDYMTAQRELYRRFLESLYK